MGETAGAAEFSDVDDADEAVDTVDTEETSIATGNVCVS